MTSLDLVVVDAFTAAPFGGNPAAVCILDASDKSSDATKQVIAAEMNLSETAYVQPRDESESNFSLRWFTPLVEVNLCGHATLATAWALFTERKVSSRRLSFHTLSGELIVERDEIDDSLLHMQFPLGAPANIDSAAFSAKLAAALSLDAAAIVNVAFCAKTRKLTVEVNSEAAVLALNPSAVDLVAVFPAGSSSPDVRGVIVTTANVPLASDYQICSRYFAPWVGIPEDPVTGSAHTVLAAYYAERLGNKFRARQASRRNGFLFINTERVPAGRVLLSGNACTVLRGKLDLSKFHSSDQTK